MDKIGAPFNGKKEICRVMMLGDDYIFNPAELTSDMIDRCSHKQSKETKGTIQSPEHLNHNLNKDFD